MNGPQGARRANAVVTLVLAIVGLAACGPTLGTTASTAVVAEPGSPSITARDLRFDRTELVVPAGRAFTIVFDNEDGAPHDVAIYDDQAAQASRFIGEIFGGPASRTYAVPALAAGTYFFRCDMHHDMHGTVVAR
ncbi:MAG TPA: cupredoxin domain-containing protein [Candidatus Limnocylindrales bacterium]|nr:cupredoxin domain-containing protein [Candidatus Limnocylindrales bacterium]